MFTGLASEQNMGGDRPGGDTPGGDTPGGGTSVGESTMEVGGAS